MTTRERYVKWHPKTNKLFQIPTEGLEFAFLTDDYRQVHQLAWCKDYMQDAVYSQVTGRDVQVYGFTHNPKTDLAIDLNKTRIMVTSFKDKDLGTKIYNCVQFLNGFEEQLKMKKTILEKCRTAPSIYRSSGVWILIGSKRWIKSPPMISLYTLLIRVGLVHTGTDHQETLQQVKSGKLKPYNWIPDKINTNGTESHCDNDSDLLKRGDKAIRAILNHGDRKLFHRNIKNNYPAKNTSGNDFSCHAIHNSSGLVGYSQGLTKDNFPHWHRLDAT